LVNCAKRKARSRCGWRGGAKTARAEGGRTDGKAGDGKTGDGKTGDGKTGDNVTDREMTGRLAFLTWFLTGSIRVQTSYPGKPVAHSPYCR
jgi:hypothetical protein